MFGTIDPLGFHGHLGLRVWSVNGIFPALQKPRSEQAVGVWHEAVVNNPYNKIARKRDAVANLKTGLIDYASLDRAVEYAARKGEYEVVLMGEESLKPQGHAKMADKQLRRRTTEVWSDASGTWKLLLRQATIYVAE